MTSRDQADTEKTAPLRMPRAVARRVHLITVARRMFGQIGYFAASMEEIAERAGVSKPVLYQNFPNKHELYLAVLDAVHHDVAEIARQAVTEQRVRDRNAVAATVNACCTALAEGGPAELLVMSDLLYEPRARQAIDNTWRIVTDTVLGAVTGIRALSRQELDVLGAIVAGTLGSVPRLWPDGEPPPDRVSVERVMTDLIWNGIEGLAGRAEQAATAGTTPVSVYLESGTDADLVETAVRDLLDTNGLAVVQAGEPVVGSWFRLLTTLVRERNACIRIGPVVLLKVDGALICRNISKREMALLEMNSGLSGAPRDVLAALDRVAG